MKKCGCILVHCYFCLNAKYANPTVQTLILLPPQWNHLFSIWSIYYFLLYLFLQFLMLLLFNYIGVFQFISSCFSKLERPNQPMICQGDIFLVPNTSLAFLSKVIHVYWSHWPHLSKCVVLLYLSNIRTKMTLQYGMLGAILVVYDVPPSPVYPVLSQSNRFWLVHIHLYKYHLACADPEALWLMKKIFSFGFSISLLSRPSYLWSPCLSLIGFLRGTDTTSSYFWSSGFSWYFIPSSLEPSSLESLSGSTSCHKSDNGSYARLLSSDAAW